MYPISRLHGTHGIHVDVYGINGIKIYMVYKYASY